jgi:hypothetical protein
MRPSFISLRVARLSLFAILAVLVAVACDAGEACPDAPTETCTPSYEPTFANVFAKTLAPSCAKSGVSCHAEGAQGGLSFLDENRAYEILATHRSVVANGASCSPMVTRLEAVDGKVRMPPARSLPEGEICAVRRWIEAGAKR